MSSILILCAVSCGVVISWHTYFLQSSDDFRVGWVEIFEFIRLIHLYNERTKLL